MRLSFGQELRLVQKQILAPKMIQSMEILQLANQALEERIEQELIENPLLEKLDEDPDLPDEAPADHENPDAPTTEERELIVDETKNNADDFERLLSMGDDLPQDQYDEKPRLSSNRMEEDSDRQADAMANMVDRPQTLPDYLCAQLGWYDMDPVVRQMAERIIYSLDHNGYLPMPLNELLDATAGPEQLAQAQKALAVIHRLDPPGVGARDVRECLLLQLQPSLPLYEPMRTLVSNHLDDLRDNRLPAIQKRTGYSIELIQETIAALRKLDPLPGARFVEQHVPNVSPDMFVTETDDGKYQVYLEEGRTPQLRISNFYRQMLQNQNATEAEREYIKRKITSAQWLIESIEQRRGTLTRVGQAIVDRQTAFLRKQAETIEPLKMQQIADMVGVHVTTVSRAVDDKWIQTPRGIFPLKRFFGGGTVSANGEEVAWDAIRLKLREIVDNEDKTAPLSDDELVTELGKHGLTVARRTVTKYRKAMNIPSSRQRRDWSLATRKDGQAENALDDQADPADQEHVSEAASSVDADHSDEQRPAVSGDSPAAVADSEEVSHHHFIRTRPAEVRGAPPPAEHFADGADDSAG